MGDPGAVGAGLPGTANGMGANDGRRERGEVGRDETFRTDAGIGGAVRDALARYRRAPLGVRAFVRLRQIVLPLREILGALPEARRVLDLGCGHGLVANALALARPWCSVTGIDLDEGRIRVATSTVGDRKNVRFLCGDARHALQGERFDGVLCIDLLHHLRAAGQGPLLRSLRHVLAAGGWLLVKDLETRPRWKYAWNWLHDAVVTRWEPVAYRSSEAIQQDLREGGYRIRWRRPLDRGYPYAHYAILCERDAEP